MIRSVVVPKLLPREGELKRVEALLTELGFQVGDRWNDERGRGIPLLAPLGALEFYRGQPPAPADVIIEVEDVTRAVDIVRQHGMPVLCDVARTHWNSDLFVADIGGCHVAFFSWANSVEAPLPKAA